MLVDHLAQSMPGEELVIFNQVPDGNGGQELPANPLFGEVVAGTPITPPAQAAKGQTPAKDTVADVSPVTDTLVAATVQE